MVASGRLPKETSDNEDQVLCGMSSEGVLLPDKVSQLQGEYREAVPDYAKLLEEYEKAAERASNSRVKSLFPSKHTWNPPGRDFERQLLNGPLGNVKYYKKITVRDKVTNRKIEYSCTNLPISSSSVPKQSSSFVSRSRLHTDEKPVFGVIVALFSHSFAQCNYFWAVIQHFTTVMYDRELKMWYASISLTQSSLIMVSYPLVVAIDGSQLFFLNARPHAN